MFRIGTAAVVPPQPPVPSDGYHSGYSSGNERADPRTSAGSYSFAPPTAADPQWQHHVANAGGIVGYASSGSLGSGTNEPPLGAVNGANGRPGGMPPVAAAAAAAAAQAAAIGSAYRGGPDAGAWFPGGNDGGYAYADRRMGAGAGVVPTPAYPTAYPVAATPPPVVPSYDYNVAAYGPMGGAGVNPGVAAAVGGNPYAASPDPYLSSDPNGPYNAAAAAAYFANVPTHTAHAQIRAMGYADPVSTMQYWQQCLDYFSRSAAMSGVPAVRARTRGARWSRRCVRGCGRAAARRVRRTHRAGRAGACRRRGPAADAGGVAGFEERRRRGFGGDSSRRRRRGRKRRRGHRGWRERHREPGEGRGRFERRLGEWREVSGSAGVLGTHTTDILFANSLFLACTV